MVFTKGNRPHNFKDIPIEEVTRDYLAGATLKDISTRYKCSTSTILNKFHINHVKTRRGGFRKGFIAWNKGKKNIYSEETLDKIRCAAKGRIPWNKGKSMNLETKNLLRVKRLGKKATLQTREKISIANREIFNREYWRKKKSTEAQGISLENWQRFIHRDRYSSGFSKFFKSQIRKRDNQICMNCGIHREKLNMALDIHHVNYDKKCTIEQNCVSLCKRCHMVTNINRPYWTQLFQEKLSKLYGYKYSEGKIIIELNKMVEIPEVQENFMDNS